MGQGLRWEHRASPVLMALFSGPEPLSPLPIPRIHQGPDLHAWNRGPLPVGAGLEGGLTCLELPQVWPVLHGPRGEGR